MSFWNFLLKGEILPMRTGKTALLSYNVGRIIASVRKNVLIAKSALISPEARISPRNGKIEIGKNTVVAANSAIQGNVRIGENSSVQYNTIIVGYGDCNEEKGIVKIGNKKHKNFSVIY